MIRFTVSRQDGHYTGFLCEGHAGYDEFGYDIVCAAVSVLTTNAVNSIEAFTEDPFEVEQREDGGYLKLILDGVPSGETALLMDSLILGMQGIQEEYGEDFLLIESSEE
jgi:uncharacterized protein YsxB (DUF464 family)